MPAWHHTPEAVATLSRITPDNLLVVRFEPIVGPSYLKLAAADPDTGDRFEVLEAVRQIAINDGFGMTYSDAWDAGRGAEYLAAYKAAPDVAAVLADRFGDPRKFGGTDAHTATLLWRAEANAALTLGLAA